MPYFHIPQGLYVPFPLRIKGARDFCLTHRRSILSKSSNVRLIIIVFKMILRMVSFEKYVVMPYNLYFPSVEY